MSVAGIVAFARSRAGSVTAACIGIGAVALLLHAAGPAQVWRALTRSTVVVPIVFVCEGLVVALEACTLRVLYGPDRHKVPPLELVRATLIMYAVAGLMPAGRPVGEAARGAMLARFVGGVRAAAAAAKQQSVLLAVQAAISVPCLMAAIVLHARPIVAWAMAANAALTLVISAGVLFTARRSRIARWLGKLAPRSEEFGSGFHAILRDEPIPHSAFALSALGRFVQLSEFTLVLYALGHGFSYLRGLTANGVALVGATIGDLIPSHVGASEANFHLAASTLSLTPSDALAIPILVHSVQMLWIAIGALTPIVWPASDREVSTVPAAQVPGGESR